MMLTDAKLPVFLTSMPTADMVRLGRDNDGGYLVDKRDVEASDVLLGFGIKDDWSFERDFVDIKPVPVHAFDPTVSRDIFFKNIIKSLYRIDKPSMAKSAYNTWAEYKRFFTGNRSHIEKFVGGMNWTNSTSLLNIKKELISDNKTKIFLKIDIEGWEYRILDQIVEISSQITGLVIEFHDVDLHLDRIRKFVEAIPLKICHVHGNNNVPLTSGDIPTVIECSFTSAQGHGVPLTMPHPLDMPGSAQIPEYRIAFVDE